MSSRLFTTAGAFFAGALLSICQPTLAADLQITQVTLDRRAIVAPQESATVRFQVNQPVTLELKIYDARNFLVWRHRSEGIGAGEHAVTWSGVDVNGAPVTPEAYFYVLEASAANGQRATYDLTDITGGETAKLEDVAYDATTQRLTFVATKPGRYFLRAGVSQAFVVNTLINNKVITEGRHEIAWDGYDVSHVFSVANHPKLMLGGFGYRLSDNAIIVTRGTVGDKELLNPTFWKDVGNSERRERIKVAREGVDPNYYRNVDQCKDVQLALVLPDNLRKNAEGIPVITGKTPVRLEIPSKDAEVMESQRGEIVFFWDNQLIYDNEVSYYPYTFHWQPPVLDGKTHLLTAFVAGFAGNLALATVKVQLGDAQ